MQELFPGAGSEFSCVLFLARWSLTLVVSSSGVLTLIGHPATLSSG